MLLLSGILCYIFPVQNLFASQEYKSFLNSNNSGSNMAVTANEYTLDQQNKGYRNFNEDTTTGLYYLHARYYDPNTRQFLTKDPAGMKNLYAYCSQDSINNVDPNGMAGVPAAFWGKLFGGLVAAGSGTALIVEGAEGNLNNQTGWNIAGAVGGGIMACLGIGLVGHGVYSINGHVNTLNTNLEGAQNNLGIAQSNLGIAQSNLEGCQNTINNYNNEAISKNQTIRDLKKDINTKDNTINQLNQKYNYNCEYYRENENVYMKTISFANETIEQKNVEINQLKSNDPQGWSILLDTSEGSRLINNTTLPVKDKLASKIVNKVVKTLDRFIDDQLEYDYSQKIGKLRYTNDLNNISNKYIRQKIVDKRIILEKICFRVNLLREPTIIRNEYF